MKKTAVFPGSFDPITKGHESIIKRAIPLFDSIIIGVGENPEKKYYFPVKQRMDWIKKIFTKYPNISIVRYKGLTTDFCKKNNIKYILRGLRTSADFEFERSIGQINKRLYPDIETVFLLSMPEYNALNSSIVRDIIKNGGSVKQFVPKEVEL